MSKKGSLVCVGTGMMLGAHITPRAKNYIETADVVFVSVSDGIVEKWIEQMNPDVRSLQIYYEEGKSRNITYRQMREAIMAEVRTGKNVCGAFYGHPGVFALAPHQAIQHAREEGFQAIMEPGISAEDCLIADLGIDPGKFGCQQYEASQFLMYRRNIDLSAYLILWQVGIVGDMSFTKFTTGGMHKQVLVDVLMRDFPAEHQVVIYEAATLPISKPRMEWMCLSDLATAEFTAHSTLVIPPCRPLEENPEIKTRLKQLTNNLI